MIADNSTRLGKRDKIGMVWNYLLPLQPSYRADRKTCSFSRFPASAVQVISAGRYCRPTGKMLKLKSVNQ